MVSIERAMKTSDYDNAERRAELTWLAEQASMRRSIVEVGSWKGTTCLAMADNTQGVVYAVDTFAGSVGEEQHQRLDEHEPDWLYNIFLKNLAEHIPDDVSKRRVVPIRLPSIVAADAFNRSLNGHGQPFRFDMVFLDASHDYDSVKADIEAWLPLLSPGALLCGHDRQWDGVSRAIDELVPGHRVAVGAIWCRS